ncbi:MAG TPA: NADP-dependent oxidoreductase [Ignavibacteriales bacterium]|nr:NADP-dependent oxidoreductase [Ignavibacteriales bacterium]
MGSAVAQIAKIKGCRAVGVTGSDEKVRFLTDELNFDAAVNYRTSRDLGKSLAEACPEGVDVYFDNVGGEISDAVMLLINDNARIPISGQISLYNAKEMPVGPRLQQILLTHTAMMKGFLVRQHEARFPDAVREMSIWLQEGKLKDKITVTEGFENIPRAFIGLFKGANTGKMLVKV